MTTVPPSDAERFAALFQGFEKAHGTYEIQRTTDSGKAVGKAVTLPGGATLAHYTQHLEGKGAGLGVVMLREDNTVVFGAIDYDDRLMDHQVAVRAIERLKLPLVLCRSKSGGGHFYVFCAEPTPAALVQERLAEWTAMLGMSKQTEQFPKQSARFNADDIGSWINLPYFHAAQTLRYAFNPQGEALALDAFLTLAEARRVPLAQMQTSWTAQATSIFPDGPPCLQVLEAQGGFVEGTRNDGMMAVAVYLRKRNGDSWQQEIDKYNEKMAKLSSSELQQIVKSAGKKEYHYRCKQAPINAHCQRKLCLGRKFGVGDGEPEEGGVQIGGVTRYDYGPNEEPIWGLEINGQRVRVTHGQLFERSEFNKAVAAQINMVPIHMPPARWLKYLNKLLQSASIVPMPREASPSGQVWEWVERFISQQVTAKTREEIWLGKPYRDPEQQRVYFRGADLMAYLDARRISYRTPQALWQLLRDRGADKHVWHLKHDRSINVWSLKAVTSLEDDAPATPPPPPPQEAF